MRLSPHSKSIVAVLLSFALASATSGAVADFPGRTPIPSPAPIFTESAMAPRELLAVHSAPSRLRRSFMGLIDRALFVSAPGTPWGARVRNRLALYFSAFPVAVLRATLEQKAKQLGLQSGEPLSLEQAQILQDAIRPLQHLWRVRLSRSRWRKRMVSRLLQHPVGDAQYVRNLMLSTTFGGQAVDLYFHVFAGETRLHDHGDRLGMVMVWGDGMEAENFYVSAADAHAGKGQTITLHPQSRIPFEAWEPEFILPGEHDIHIVRKLPPGNEIVSELYIGPRIPLTTFVPVHNHPQSAVVNNLNADLPVYRLGQIVEKWDAVALTDTEAQGAILEIAHGNPAYTSHGTAVDTPALAAQFLRDEPAARVYRTAQGTILLRPVPGGSSTRPRNTVRRVIFVLLALLTLRLPYLHYHHAATIAGLSVVFGALTRSLIGNPDEVAAAKWSKRLLTVAILCLAAGLDIGRVWLYVGLAGIVGTSAVVVVTMAAGLLLARWFKTDWIFSVLFTVGMSICGGSAIAAAAVALGLKNDDPAHQNSQSLALAVILVFNTLALWLFPFIGHFFHLSPAVAGYLFAWAIQDTNSVVEAAHLYNPHTVPIATTLKLVRAAHIFLTTLLISLNRDRLASFLRGKPIGSASHDGFWRKIRKGPPSFIWGFALVAAAVNVFPVLRPVGQSLKDLAKPLLVTVFFLIGSTFKLATFKKVLNSRIILQAVSLWLMLVGGVLLVIQSGWIYTARVAAPPTCAVARQAYSFMIPRAEYIVKKGDNLWRIAHHKLGLSSWRTLYEANRHGIGTHPNLIHAKLHLGIPGTERLVTLPAPQEIVMHPMSWWDFAVLHPEVWWVGVLVLAAFAGILIWRTHAAHVGLKRVLAASA